MDAIGLLAAASSGILSALTFGACRGVTVTIPYRSFIIVFPGNPTVLANGAGGSNSAAFSGGTIVAAGGYFGCFNVGVNFDGSRIMPDGMSLTFAYLT